MATYWKISRIAQKRSWKARGTTWNATLATTDANTRASQADHCTGHSTLTPSPHSLQMNVSITLKPTRYRIRNTSFEATEQHRVCSSQIRARNDGNRWKKGMPQSVSTPSLAGF